MDNGVEFVREPFLLIIVDSDSESESEPEPIPEPEPEPIPEPIHESILDLLEYRGRQYCVIS